MIDSHVFVLSCPGRVLGVYRSINDANAARREYKSDGYKGLEVTEHLVL